MIKSNNLFLSTRSLAYTFKLATTCLVFCMAHAGVHGTITVGVVYAQVQVDSVDAPRGARADSRSEQLETGGTGQVATSASDTATQTRVRELIYVLRNNRVASRDDEWGSAIRELGTIGSPALPELLLELKNTERNATLRALLFTLRVIDDRRALAPVIEALPKADRLSAQGSDFRLDFVDADLQRFMKQHQNFPYKDDHFHYGRPINEILGTLHKLARQPFPELESRRDLSGTWNARHWEVWSRKHADVIQVSRGESIQLPARDVDLVESDGVRRFGQLFPTGPKQRLSSVASVDLPWVLYANLRPYLDLDTGKLYEQLESLRVEPGKRFDVRDFRKWQSERGIDLAVHNRFDLHLWLIDNDRWDSLEAEVQSGEPLDMGSEAGSLTPFDKETRELKPDQIGTFLFTTAEGGRGVMRVYPAAADRSKRIEYRLWNRDTVKVQPANQRPATSPGEWRSEKFVFLKRPGFGNPCVYDLEVGKAEVLPESLATEKQAPDIDELMKKGGVFTDGEISAWARKRGIDLATTRIAVGDVPDKAEIKGLHNGQIATLSLIDAHTAAVTADAFETLSVAHARVILSHRTSPFRIVMVNPELEPTAPPATAVFETKSGLVGLLQISKVGEELSSIGFRYKLANSKSR